MNFLIYILLFFALNTVMMFSPGLGMILYFAFIAYIFSSSKKRMRSFSQQQSYQQRSYTNQSQYNNEQNANTHNDHKVKDAIDVEYTEEEIS
ncbi:MAG: hypothetical protein EOM11_07515 [Erysipelotrichia bacterium]|nr:hypothetical protein [Erysipelotrichia bacterium]